MRKKKYEHLETLIISHTALLLSIMQEMDRKGLIDGDRVIKDYAEELNYTKSKLKL